VAVCGHGAMSCPRLGRRHRPTGNYGWPNGGYSLAFTALRVQAREIRGRAQDARQDSVDLGKRSQQASDRADLLDAEADAVEDDASRFRARRRPEEGTAPSS
jgi:hypothetical protein